MSNTHQTRVQPWKKWYKPLEKASTDLALAVLPVFLAGNGGINGADQLDSVVYTATCPTALQTMKAASKATGNAGNAEQGNEIWKFERKQEVKHEPETSG